METGIERFRNAFFSGTPLMDDADIRALSPAALSFLGDSVFELMVRTDMLLCGVRRADHLDHEKKEQVNAAAQAALLQQIDPLLTKEERRIVRRGRNARHHSTAKNQTVHDYNEASGLEALCAYLFLRGETKRLTELMVCGKI